MSFHLTSKKTTISWRSRKLNRWKRKSDENNVTMEPHATEDEILKTPNPKRKIKPRARLLQQVGPKRAEGN